MSHVLVNNGAVVKYPYSVYQLRRDNPQTSFPDAPSDAMLGEFGVARVIETPRPDCDPLTQDVVEEVPAYVDGEWRRVWSTVDADALEVERRKARELESVKAFRAAAYRDEADPIFFKAQRGEANMSEWTSKVEQIRARYPYPEWASNNPAVGG